MSLKNKCVFYPDGAVRKLREYAETSKHGMEKRWNILKEAQRFISKDDAELWSLVIDPYILRSHYVHTNSLCPVCRKKRLLYDWEIDPISFPWKVRCPDCKNYFPKNDFYSFYKSGIDETGVFRYEKADKTLLFNTEHPDPNDPLHMFAVDDGNGYCNGDTIQRFIGYYLIHGHHKDLVRGIYSLSYAYLLTGKPEYARKCAVLLDRYADYWPNYDAHTQVYVHEQLYSTEGYFGYWFHSYYDISVFAHAYDIIRGAMLEDQELLAFVKAQKEKHGLPYTVNSPQDILQHIENRILKDALANYKKCRSNFPMTHALYAIIHAVLGNDETVDSLLEEIIVQCTERDGATKENGLTGYTNHAKEQLTEILLKFVHKKPSFIDDLLKKYPSLIEAYRFFIDTLCIDEYYPKIGDCLAFAEPSGGCLHKSPGSLYMLYKCYKITGDTVFIKGIWSAVKERYTELLAQIDFLGKQEFDQMIEEIDKVLKDEGYEIDLPSVIKPNWHLAILRSGKGEHKRALWIDFDWEQSGHEHEDPMNIGLFCMGIDMMPDWGYPPVVYNGGFYSDEFNWGKSIFVHNCATQDRSPGIRGAGKVDLWLNSESFKTVTCSNPNMIKDGKQFARTLSLTDLSEEAFYIADIFRLQGNGRLYERYMHAAIGSLSYSGMNPVPTVNDYPKGLFFENLRKDPSPKQNRYVDFHIEDYFNYVAKKRDWHLRCTDLTTGSEIMIADMRFFGNRNYERILKNELLMPCFITQKQTEEPFQPVVFVQVMEPYDGKSKILNIERLAVDSLPDECVVIRVESLYYTDLLIYNDPYQRRCIALSDYGIKTDALTAFIRYKNDSVYDVRYSQGSHLSIHNKAFDEANI
jgi:hypothetical protein